MPGQAFDRDQFIEENLHTVWKKSERSRALHLEVGGFHLMVMTDHNDRSVWTCLVRPARETSGGDFLPRKYRTEESAKRAALEEAADRIER